MKLNGIVNNQAINSYQTSMKQKKQISDDPETKDSQSVKVDTGVIYEPSKNTEVPSTKKYSQNIELINKMKADADARTAEMRSLVEKLITGQGNTLGEADSIWSFLRKGDFTVDAETKAKAQADIAEDGYWGVEKTSDRILEFAKALTGGNPDKIEEMRNAFKKGFEEATKTWGDKLPDISQKTFEATMKKFDQWAEESKVDDIKTPETSVPNIKINAEV